MKRSFVSFDLDRAAAARVSYYYMREAETS